MSLLLGEHRRYLADAARLTAYRSALARVVQAGDVVLDLGSGTGVLAVLACRAGAERVYSVDSTSMIAIARAVAAANGLADRITCIQAHSLRVELPEQVDIVVADQLGAFGLEAGLVPSFTDAHRRHLRPGGRLVPGRLELRVAPVSSPELWHEVSFWDQPTDDIDLRALQAVARNSPYYLNTGAEELLGASALLVAPALAGNPGSPLEGEAELVIERSGTLHGVAGWFDAELIPGVVISNGAERPDRLGRRNVVLPIDSALEVEPGSRVLVQAILDPSAGVQRWKVRVEDPDGREVATSVHTLTAGQPMSRDDLRRTRPDHRPAITPRGRAKITALSMFGGDHDLREIEAAVWSQHRDAFAVEADVAGFVSQLVRQEAS